MYYLLQPFRVLWKLWFFTLFLTSLFAFFPLFRWALVKESRFNMAFNAMRAWSWWLFLGVGISTMKEVKGKLPEGPFIICPNHCSYIDIISMYRVFSRYFIFMGKSEIKQWPLFHIFFSSGMNISVNRESIKEAHSAYEQAKEKIDRGVTIVIFPEGTIPDGAPKLGAFKNGAFKLAMEKNIPIVPVSFINNYRRLQIGPALRQLGGPGPSRVVVHEAVLPSAYATKGIGEMKKDIFAIIQRPIQEYHGDK